MSFNNNMETALMQHLLGGALWIQKDLYLGLWLTTLTDASEGTSEGEVRWAQGETYGYARNLTVSLSGGWSRWGVPLAGVIKNAEEIRFNPATGGPWGTITDFAIIDAATYGEMLAYGQLIQPLFIDEGSIARFAPDALVFALI